MYIFEKCAQNLYSIDWHQRYYCYDEINSTFAGCYYPKYKKSFRSQRQELVNGYSLKQVNLSLMVKRLNITKRILTVCENIDLVYVSPSQAREDTLPSVKIFRYCPLTRVIMFYPIQIFLVKLHSRSYYSWK